MKKLIFLSTFLLFSTLIFSQSKDEKIVAETVESLRKAMIDGDRAALLALSHENLTYGHSNGKVENQAQFVEAIASGNNNFETIDLTEQTIKITGKTAVVRHHFKATTVIEGKPSYANIAVLQVYQKIGKKWLLLARQAVKI
jgi:ketosteroid isomerase-like protein